MDTKVEIIILMFMVSISTSLAQESKSVDLADEVAVADVTTSSRLLTGQQKTDWVESMSAKLAITARSTGPFGLTQDPNVKPIKPREKKVEKGAFLEAIGAIKINTVMPSNNKFTSSAREFSVGDQFPIIKNHRQFDVEIVDVSSSGIIFKNTATGEQVRKNLNALPAGMTRSSDLGSIPGVYSAEEKNTRPLNLDDGSLTQNRK